ncbi:hypothetical protein [Tolypothrix sp. VBCCA 56010]|uniref:hypothetical protein n=1 Tax=Tolypothrix sp. VBCCA 56010 TaxID=3137731 RepID=UPI003D7E8B5F
MEELTVKLRILLQLVNDWLKFAETKNAVLLAFSGTGITSTLKEQSVNVKDYNVTIFGGDVTFTAVQEI